MNSIRISLIIPIYMVEKYIQKCAYSVFDQSYEDIEYIFVNDATKDSSIDLLSKTINNFPNRTRNTKIIHHDKNLGLTAARQTGIKNSTGDYIWHIDSDDYISKDCIKDIIKIIENTDADIITINGYEDYGNKLKKIELTDIASISDELYNLLYRTQRHELWLMIAKKSLYNDISFDNRIGYGEDWATTPKIVYNAKKMAHLNQECYYYRKSNNISLTSVSFTYKNIDSIWNAYNSILLYFKDKDIPSNISFYEVKMKLLIHMIKTSSSNNDKGIQRQLMLDNRFYIKRIPKSFHIKDRIVLFLIKYHKIQLLRWYLTIGTNIRKLYY